jgi:hypothetical protein
MPVAALRPWHAIRARPDAEGRALIGIEAARLTGYLPVELTRCTTAAASRDTQARNSSVRPLAGTTSKDGCRMFGS